MQGRLQVVMLVTGGAWLGALFAHFRRLAIAEAFLFQRRVARTVVKPGKF